MSGDTMNNPFLSSIAAVALMIGASTLSGCSRPAEQAPLQGTRIGGPFTLTDQDGKRVSDRDFAGQYRLIYFGYTFCPDVCPTDVQHLMQGFKLFEQRAPALAARVQPIFISIDPARDTPPVLRQFVRAFHPRLIGLTGSDAEIAAVAKAFAIYYRKQDGPAGAGGYLMDHSRQTILFGPTGDPIALIPQDRDSDVIAAELQRWVR